LQPTFYHSNSSNIAASSSANSESNAAGGDGYGVGGNGNGNNNTFIGNLARQNVKRLLDAYRDDSNSNRALVLSLSVGLGELNSKRGAITMATRNHSPA
jgi:hypothetical protein